MSGAPRARDVERRLQGLANPARAAASLRYFKTGPGEYGEGDRFRGLTLTQVRQLTKEFVALPLDEIEALLESSWHEARTVAVLIMAKAYRKADERTRAALYRLYLRRTDRINNWDLVDGSAPYVVGEHLVARSRAPLRRLARSKLLWDRRVAVIATAAFIKRGEFDDTLEIADLLMGDRHDLIHKAVGWMLREVGKKDERVLRAYLDRNAGRMPRTMLRYAIEKFSPALRQHYMRVERAPKDGSTRITRSERILHE